jgi:hypothetical protein
MGGLGGFFGDRPPDNPARSFPGTSGFGGNGAHPPIGPGSGGGGGGGGFFGGGGGGPANLSAGGGGGGSGYGPGDAVVRLAATPGDGSVTITPASSSSHDCQHEDASVASSGPTTTTAAAPAVLQTPQFAG